MQKGFSLIELIIVIAIIGIISTSAVSSYYFFMIKSRINTALYEISSVKPAYEIIVTQSLPATITHSDLNIKPETSLCSISITLPDYTLSSSKVLSCTLKNQSALQNNAEIYLTRTPSGQYQCKTIGIPNYLIPTECK
ncbi:hypothetical protein F941_03068 [Acinetobacter bouvetii DSM 14964 = CIP 107468]|uniref:Prepilin-type N-terminal cleavage/methylation domain-containing protein n=1 Tax=Acinetobacter bouvetii DSM 14964 = CIP 107468 TaxID=1120925 RepID=N9DLA0_9GAMM|nr:pilin [Acinetobacter bouvetii]ENV81510.1 hypothetical protein F941_03068 [Acinetobacter bouvetii DSM 14964 = CIP 107468]